MNLDQDFLRYEVVGGTTYYGYAISPTTLDVDKNWSIRAVVGTGPSEVKWNANSRASYTAIWDNKADHFATPGTVSATFTSSVTPATQYESVLIGLTWSSVLLPDKVRIDVTWPEVSGVDQYRITTSDQNGVIYNELSDPYMNPWNRGVKFTTQITGTKYSLKGISGMTYSFKIESINQAGSSEMNYTYLT
jgi:hypothetical protein